MPITIKEVAQQAGVSVGTVSNVLNGKLGEYGPETLERVMGAVRQLGYHPNRVARSLVRREACALGVSFVDQGKSLRENPYLVDVLDGVMAVASEEQYNLVLYTRLQPGGEDQYLSVLLDRRIDALCLVAPDEDSPLLKMLRGTDLPFVVAGVEYDDPGIPWIDVDNAAGAQMAMDCLLAHGHTRIAHLGGCPPQRAAQMRAEVWRQTLCARGVPVREDWLRWCDFDTEQARQAMHELLEMPERPTAVFAANDQIALGVMAAAREKGVRVPDQLSVIGFDDIHESETVAPPLTTIRHPMYEVGYRAARWLMARLRNETEASLRERLIPALVARGTVARMEHQASGLNT